MTETSSCDAIKVREHSFSICLQSSEERLKSAISIWKKNRSTLGLFPKGAFEDHAKQNWIIYLLESGLVKGYLLYRIARGRIVISHLCILEELRGRGGARILFDALKRTTDNGLCRGVEVRCRSDYEISRMWPSLGFECMRNVSGRAKKGSELTIWFYKYDINDFFYDMLPRQDEDDLTWAVLDANVVFKIADHGKADSEESLALMSDTISSYARYFVTPEIFVETERKRNPVEKNISICTARKFEKIEVKKAAFDNYRKLLMPLWGEIKTDRDRSDLHHIAYTAAAGFQSFITQDAGLLNKADAIYEICNVAVLRPVEFIIQLDQLENLEKYTPRSISRTRYRESVPTFDNIAVIADNFCQPNKHEKRSQLEAIIRSAVANPKEYKTILISNDENLLIAFLCFKKGLNEVSIELMRHNGDATSKAIAQNFTWHEIFSRIETDVFLIKFSDRFSSSANDEMFNANGFIRNENGWVRISVNLICGFDVAKIMIDKFLKESKELEKYTKERLIVFLNQSDKKPCIYEEVFWPLKISNEDIPTYLIPIKPVWALHLFDKNLAEGDLWGADPGKHFNIENVYYRSPQPCKISAGDRVLWYVSSDGKNKVSEIRACSRVLSVEIDTAFKLFKKYKRLGIYEWRNLMEITGNNPAGEIMAVRFYQTECFSCPIKLEQFSLYGINGQPFGPKAITNEQFLKIYATGINSNG